MKKRMIVLALAVMLLFVGCDQVGIDIQDETTGASRETHQSASDSVQVGSGMTGTTVRRSYSEDVRNHSATRTASSPLPIRTTDLPIRLTSTA